MCFRYLLASWFRGASRSHTVSLPEGSDIRQAGYAETLAAHYRDAFDALPESQRRIFWLHRIDGLSIAVVADRLGCSTMEVERLLAQALLTISESLDRVPSEAAPLDEDTAPDPGQ